MAVNRKCSCGCYVHTSILLQNPTFELYDRVSKGAAVLTLAAIPNFMAANVKLAEGVQGSHLTVTHVS